MITDRIRSLFEFIEYLHSNTDNFNQFETVLGEARFLKKEKSKLKPDLNFSDKMKSDELQEGIVEKFEVIKENIIIPIINKSIELDICDFSNENEKLTGSWRNKYHSEIHDLKKNFNREDLSDIFSFKKKYLEFRTKTKGETYLGLDFFFGDLDDVTKDLFDFFKVTDFNEFETFEEKTFKAESIHEAVKLVQQGAKKITLPIDFLNPSTIQQEIKIDSLPTPIDNEKPKTEKGKGLTIAQIALKLAYEGESVTLENADEIISAYGLNSGKKLYQQVTFYSQRRNRLCFPETKKKAENKIHLFESIIDLLPLEHQEKAKDDLEHLEKQYNAHYQ